MNYFDEYTYENKIDHNSEWPYIPDHPYRMLIVDGPGSGKANALLNLISNQPGIDKIHLCAKDPCGAKYQYSINKREKVEQNHYDDPKAFMEYSNDMQDVYKNIGDYNPKKNVKVLIVFDNTIADMINNKKLNSIVTELFIRGRKLNISIVFITQSYFKVPKDVRLNSTHFFIMKIPNKRELQQITLSHSSDIDFKDFIKIFKKYTAKPNSFLVNDNLTNRQSFKVQKESFRIIYNKPMTIEDQIKDKKLQYGINREAAKISALSSGKIDKYEYLTSEEILPSNQQQIIGQAKFTYSPLGKAFQKQTKTIEDQGKKQFDALANLKPKEIKPGRTKPIEYGDYFLNGLVKIGETYEHNDFNNLIYHFKSPNISSIDFSKFKTPLHILKSIYYSDRTLEDIEKGQIELKRYLGQIKHRSPKNRSREQEMKINNIKNLYDSREKVIQLFNDYAENMSKKIYDSKQKGTGLKILTPNQMLNKLPIALAQIKAGNNS